MTKDELQDIVGALSEKISMNFLISLKESIGEFPITHNDFLCISLSSMSNLVASGLMDIYFHLSESVVESAYGDKEKFARKLLNSITAEAFKTIQANLGGVVSDRKRITL